jgi:hypothetical protein
VLVTIETSLQVMVESGRWPFPAAPSGRSPERCLIFCRPHTIVPVGVLGHERQVVLGADHRPAVAGQHDDRQRSEDRVDGAPLQAELAQVRARQQRAGALEQAGSCVMPLIKLGCANQPWQELERASHPGAGPPLRPAPAYCKSILLRVEQRDQAT